MKAGENPPQKKKVEILKEKPKEQIEVKPDEEEDSLEQMLNKQINYN